MFVEQQTEKKLAERTGLEPATSGVTGQHSNQLNYRSTPLQIAFSQREEARIIHEIN